MIPDTYSPQERIEIRKRYYALLDAWQTRKEVEDRWMVRKAYYFAVYAHKDARRRTGEPYIYHPLEVATIVAKDIGLGRTSIICALLHDVVEDADFTLEDINELFGEKVARIIDGLTKINNLTIEDDVESMQAENFRKIICSLSYDARVVLIKLADRLHNMRTLDSMPRHKQLKIASETTYLYAPLAYRLGLYAIKSELEDLAIKYTDPAVYQTITQKMNQIRAGKTAELQAFVLPVEKELAKMKVNVRVLIKEKSANSIWQRMKENEIPFEEVHDSFIIRFVIDCPLRLEKIECWETYAVLTSIYRPNTAKLRDWISLPKANGYESLHAMLMSKTGNWVEVQIRSERMEEIAEKGFAAYWKHKADAKTESGFDEWLNKAKDLITNETSSALDFVNSFKLDLFSDEIFVFTPKGDMISLPKGSTVLDLAYNIHSEIGNHSIAANVNSRLVQLDQVLFTGDQVEIITSDSQHPQEKWFEFLATAYGKSRLKIGLKDYRKTFREDGEEKFNKIMEKLGIEAGKTAKITIIEAEKLSGSVDLFYYISIGRINEQTIKDIFHVASKSSSIMRYLTLGLLKNNSKSKPQKNVVDINSDFDYTVSTCCNPIPGDDVVAFQFSDQPMQIHRTNCPNAIKLMSHHGNNIVQAKWQPKDGITFLASLKITAVDTMGLLNRITTLLSVEMKLNLHSIQMEANRELVDSIVSFYVHNKKELDIIIEKLHKMDGVKKITRMDHSQES